MQTTETFEPLISPPEAATLLDIHVKTLVRLARQGKVPAIRLGKLWRFRRSSLDHWIAAQVQSTCQPVA